MHGEGPELRRPRRTVVGAVLATLRGGCACHTATVEFTHCFLFVLSCALRNFPSDCAFFKNQNKVEFT